MPRNGTNSCIEPGRQLVPLNSPSDSPRFTGQRPMATFITHLLVQCDPGSGSSRLERTRHASAIYSVQAKRFG